MQLVAVPIPMIQMGNKGYTIKIYNIVVKVEMKAIVRDMQIAMVGQLNENISEGVPQMPFENVCNHPIYLTA